MADGLVGLAVDPSAAPAVRAHAEAVLRDVATRTADNDPQASAHRQALHHAVVRFLEDRDWTPAQLPAPLPAPPGDPIGSACAMSSRATQMPFSRDATSESSTHPDMISQECQGLAGPRIAGGD